MFIWGLKSEVRGLGMVFCGCLSILHARTRVSKVGKRGGGGAIRWVKSEDLCERRSSRQVSK